MNESKETQKKWVPVVAGYIQEKGHLLVTRRFPQDARGGLWEFPGGKVKPGERPAQALARELYEELGIKVEVGEKLVQVEHDYGDVAIRLHLLSARIVAGRPRPLGCAELRWVPSEEMETLELAPADRKLVQLLRGAGKLPPGDS